MAPEVTWNFTPQTQPMAKPADLGGVFPPSPFRPSHGAPVSSSRTTMPKLWTSVIVDEVIRTVGEVVHRRVFPQIAIAIGVLTSNRGGRRRTTLADWTWHQGAIAGCSGRGAIAGCHCKVPLWCAMVGRKEGDDQLCGVDVVPLLFAIAGCHSSVLWLGGDDQLWGSGRGAGCHCNVLWWGEGKVTTNFGGVDVVPLLGANLFHIFVLYSRPPISPRHPRKQQ